MTLWPLTPLPSIPVTLVLPHPNRRHLAKQPILLLSQGFKPRVASFLLFSGFPSSLLLKVFILFLAFPLWYQTALDSGNHVIKNPSLALAAHGTDHQLSLGDKLPEVQIPAALPITTYSTPRSPRPKKALVRSFT